MNINRIKADIITAENNCNNIINTKNDLFLYDVAAYHTQQAIEKELKYILHNIYGEDDTTRRFKTHNISTLLIMIDKYDKNFISQHTAIVDCSDEITNWEASSRYGEENIASKDRILEIITEAKELLTEIVQYENSLNKDDNDIELD